MFQDKRRGDVWFRENPIKEYIGYVTGGSRTVLVVSSNESNRGSNTVTVIPLTKTPIDPGKPRYWRVPVTVSQAYGVSTALVAQVTTCNASELTEYRGSLSYADMSVVEENLFAYLGLGDNE